MNRLFVNSLKTSHSNLYEPSPESLIIDEIYLSLQNTKGAITNKDVILAILARMEEEKDALQTDILRNALQLVVHRTADDL